jgi:beta-lactamase class A
VSHERRRWIAIALPLLAAVLVAVLLVVVVDLPDPSAGSEASGGSGAITVTSTTAPTDGSAASTATSPADPFPDDGIVESMTPWPPPPADPTGPVAQAVADAEANGVRLAVVVVDRSTGATLTQVEQDAAFPTLSLVKLMIAADVLTGGDGSEPGRLDPTTREMLRDIISQSDDVAGSDLYAQLGGDRMVERVADRFGLTGTSPTPDGQYWGNVQSTAADLASLLGQALADPVIAPVLGQDMLAATAIAADGVDQRIGMRTVPAAGSKQGWGCCLSGAVGIHSVGFTDSRIVVVLSSAEPDDYSLGSQDGLALQADPGAQVSIAAVTAAVHAALGGPAA